MSIGGSFTGGSQLEGMLKLLADPVKFTAKIDELKQAEERANAAISQVGHVNDILRLRNEAITLRASAAGEVSAAEERAQALMASAKKEAQAILDGAKSKADLLVAQAERDKRQAHDTVMAAEAKAAEARGLMKDVEAEQGRIHHARASLAEDEKALVLREEEVEAKQVRILRAQQAARDALES